MKSSLQSKTVRPGLGTYSFYMSDRRAAGRGKTSKAKAAKKRANHHRLRVDLLAVAVLVALLFGYRAVASPPTDTATKSAKSTTQASTSKPKPKSAPTTTPAPAATQPAAAAPIVHGPCGGNSLSRLVVISINQRHLWACQEQTVVYDSPVVTGMQNLAADLTPIGTYHIYSKQTNVTLRGSDSTGSWDDPVYYWMPFLSNRYGIYGFHDATWRPDSDFGNIDPYSMNGSHGCVELPLATAKWLYGWVYVGTAVTIES